MPLRLSSCLPLRCGVAAVVDRAIQPLDVPVQQRGLDILFLVQCGHQQLIEMNRGCRQLQPAQMAQRGIDDGIGAGVEQFQIDVADQPPQIEEALRMAQPDMQHLMRDQADLLLE